MANEEHVAVLKQGVDAWNAWRRQHPAIRPSLRSANLRSANLSRVDLSEADLTGADLTGADLRNASLRRASTGRTSFGGIDLSRTIGLESVRHAGPSTIGIDTIYFSGGKIPETFLRGAGVPDDFITYMHSLTGQAFEFYSC